MARYTATTTAVSPAREIDLASSGSMAGANLFDVASSNESGNSAVTAAATSPTWVGQSTRTWSPTTTTEMPAAAVADHPSHFSRRRSPVPAFR